MVRRLSDYDTESVRCEECGTHKSQFVCDECGRSVCTNCYEDAECCCPHCGSDELEKL